MIYSKSINVIMDINPWICGIRNILAQKNIESGNMPRRTIIILLVALANFP
jgi:hypothetical protein